MVFSQLDNLNIDQTFSAVYEEDMDDVHSYWKEYFKVFHIVPKKVCNFYLLLSKVDVLVGGIFDLFCEGLTSVIISSNKPMSIVLPKVLTSLVLGCFPGLLEGKLIVN